MTAVRRFTTWARIWRSSTSKRSQYAEGEESVVDDLLKLVIDNLFWPSNGLPIDPGFNVRTVGGTPTFSLDT